jgi:hypothetical protein
LPIAHIRDFFLSDVKNPQMRIALWNDVRSDILHNSSVRETFVMVEGEQLDAWQYITTSTLLTPDRRRTTAVMDDQVAEKQGMAYFKKSSLYPTL